MSANIRIAIAEDHDLVRQGMISLLKDEEGIQFVLDAPNGLDLLEGMKKTTVDVVLLDIDMPVLNGRQTLELLRQRHPEVKVIMISMHYEDAFISEFITNGANGFLPKNSDIERVVDAIFAVWEQGYYFDNKVSKALLSRLINEKQITPSFDLDPLNEREILVLKLACEEKTTQEIADLLFLSKRTVEGYRKVIARKTNSKNVAGLVIYAIKHGIISVN